MGKLMYTEQSTPFKNDFDYIVKDNEGKDIRHSIHIEMTEQQLSDIDITDKKTMNMLEDMDTVALSKLILTKEQIAELKKNTKNDYQYRSILISIFGEIMGFINVQRFERGTSAILNHPTYKRFQR